jgi:hypothetical protein
MSLHRFAVGESVLCTRQYTSDSRCKSAFTVMTCLSTDDLIPQYLIRSRSSSFERRASEYELTRVPQPQLAGLWRSGGPFAEGTDAQPANANLVPYQHLPRAVWHKNERRGASEGRHG